VKARPHAVYLTYRGLCTALQVFPDPAASLIATVSGHLMWHVWRGKRPLLRRNFRRVLGADASPAELERCVRGAFHSYAHYWVEAARTGATPSRKLLAHWEIEGIEHLRKATDRRKGVVLVLPHLGNWEYGGRVLAETGFDMSAVAEVLEPPELYEWFVAQRERLGIEIFALRPGMSGELLKALAAGKVLCLLADRDLAGNGIPVEFFGEETTLPAGPATLALRSGAALVTCAVYHEPATGRHFAVVNPEIDCSRKGTLREDVARLTRQVAAEMEGFIRRAPEQWHMFQPNWPSDVETGQARHRH
jgi:phosphatidylinositol dimannoside acyltransferase